MIITISGTPGSGKSTIAKSIEKKFRYKRFYMGDLQRKIAKSKGITLEELQKIEEKDPSIDYEVDNEMEKIFIAMNDAIVEGRTAAGLFKKWNMKKKAIHIFLNCELKESAKRIFKQKKAEGNGNRNEKTAKTITEQMKYITQRENDDRKRFKSLYNLDIYNKKLYDLIIDTTKLTPQQAVSKIITFIKTR